MTDGEDETGGNATKSSVHSQVENASNSLDSPSTASGDGGNEGDASNSRGDCSQAADQTQMVDPAGSGQPSGVGSNFIKTMIGLFTKFQLNATVEEKVEFYQAIGSRPSGWLYMYVIPLHDVQVVIRTKIRGCTEAEYSSSLDKYSEWCLVKMGMTRDDPKDNRLKYFTPPTRVGPSGNNKGTCSWQQKLDKNSVPKDYKAPSVNLAQCDRYEMRGYFPKDTSDGVTSNEDLVYCVQANIGLEEAARKACFLGGWDVGGNTNSGEGYFFRSDQWLKFLFGMGMRTVSKELENSSVAMGPTECLVVPKCAVERIKTWVKVKHVFGSTDSLVETLRHEMREGTLKLLNDEVKDQLRTIHDATIPGKTRKSDRTGPSAEVDLRLFRFSNDDFTPDATSGMELTKYTSMARRKFDPAFLFG